MLGVSMPVISRVAAAPPEAAYTSVDPVSVLDTRNGIGAPTGKVASGGVVTLALGFKVPAGASAAVLNLTVVDPSAEGWITA